MSSRPITTQQVYDQLGQALRGYFARRLADPNTADDLVQEAFVRIHRGLPELEDQQRVGPWVMRIAQRTLADHLRRARPSAAVTEDVEAQAEPGLGDSGWNEELLVCLRAMMSRLSDEHRRALEAVDLGGVAQADYAESVGVSLSGAKSRVQHGRAQLKQQLLDCCEVQFDRFGRPVDWDTPDGCGSQCGCRDD